MGPPRRLSEAILGNAMRPFLESQTRLANVLGTADRLRLIGGPDLAALFPRIQPLFPQLDRLTELMQRVNFGTSVRLVETSLVVPQFTAATRVLDTLVRPLLPDLAAFSAVAAGTQRRMLDTIGVGLRPMSSLLGDVMSPDLLLSLRKLADQLGEVQQDHDAAEAVLIEAGERSPALRPLLDWLRENQHLAGWAAVVFMLVFFAVEQVEALGSDAHLKLPPGSVLYVPNRGDTSTVTIKIEKSGGSTP